MASARFVTIFAVLMVVCYVSASPCPEPEPQPSGCWPARAVGASETKCGAVVVPTCVTIHHRCGAIHKCCPWGGYGYGGH